MWNVLRVGGGGAQGSILFMGRCRPYIWTRFVLFSEGFGRECSSKPWGGALLHLFFSFLPFEKMGDEGGRPEEFTTPTDEKRKLTLSFSFRLDSLQLLQQGVLLLPAPSIYLCGQQSERVKCRQAQQEQKTRVRQKLFSVSSIPTSHSQQEKLSCCRTSTNTFTLLLYYVFFFSPNEPNFQVERFAFPFLARTCR